MSAGLIAVLFITTFIGGALQSLVGFGIGLMIMAILPHFLDSVVHVTALSNISGLAASVAVVLKCWKKASIKDVLLMLPGFFLLMPLGARLMMSISNRAAKIVLGVFLICYALYNLLIKEIRFRINAWVGVGCGALSGLMSGMFALSSPPVAVYMLNATDDKEVYISTSQAFLLVGSIYGFTVRLLNGQFTTQVWEYAAVVVVGIVTGVLLGGKLRSRVNMEIIRRWIYIFIVITGFSLFF